MILMTLSISITCYADEPKEETSASALSFGGFDWYGDDDWDMEKVRRVSCDRVVKMSSEKVDELRLDAKKVKENGKLKYRSFGEAYKDIKCAEGGVFNEIPEKNKFSLLEIAVMHSRSIDHVDMLLQALLVCQEEEMLCNSGSNSRDVLRSALEDRPKFSTFQDNDIKTIKDVIYSIKDDEGNLKYEVLFPLIDKACSTKQ